MKCDEAKRFAHLYVDGEFDERESARVEEHLSGCEACRIEVQSLRDFKQTFVARMNPPTMPADSRERILAAMHAPTTQTSTVRRWILPAAVAVSIVAALAVAKSVQTPTESGDRRLTDLVEESVAAHEAELPLEAEGSEDEIRGFVAKAVHLDAPPPLMESGDTRLLGVRLTHVGPSPAVLYKYKHLNRSLSVLRVPRTKNLADMDLVKKPSPVHFLFDGAQKGYTVTAFESPEFTHTVVSDIPTTEVRKLIPASL